MMLLRQVMGLFAPYYREHVYDWENPDVLTIDGVFLGGKPYTYTVFTCTNCSVKLTIDRSQVQHLPRRLRYGCRGKDRKSES
jgi:hypothetical protein